MRHIRRAAGAETGSVMLALLFVTLVGGLLVALVVNAWQGQRFTRADRTYTFAIHNAEAGVQDAVYTLNRRSREATFGGNLGDPHPGSTTTGQYTWSAIPSTDSRSWRVSSTGSYQGRSRTVLADVRNVVRFPVAILSDRSTRLVGNNVLDTYSSPSTPPAMTPNVAVLGSNGTISAPNASTSTGGSTLYNFQNDPNPNRCTGTTALCSTATREAYPADLTSDDALRFISTAIAKCKTDSGLTTLPDWIASRDAVISGGVAYFAPAGTGPYCFRNMLFDRTTQFSPSPGKPAVVYLEGTVSVANRITVNIPAGDLAPASPNLQIYTATTGAVDWATGSRFAGAVYAPRAECGERSGAIVEIYGVLVCGTFNSRGGLRYHYDLALRTQLNNTYSIVKWQEQ